MAEQKQNPPPNPKPIVNKAPVPEQKFSADYKHIVRIAQVDVPGDKPIKIALKKIKGVGFNLAASACNLANIRQEKKAGDLSEAEIKRLNDILIHPAQEGIPVWMLNHRKDYETGENKHLFMGDLDFAKDSAIKLMKKIKCYKGIRHSRGLPVRGQRTKSNFRKNKGKVTGVTKKKEAPPKSDDKGGKKDKK